MKIALFQLNTVWANIQANLDKVEEELKHLPSDVDVVILPEMFSTGFCINRPDLAEPINGHTVETLKHLAKEYNLALVGSYIAKEDNRLFNLGFFITPENSYFAAKRHLFARAGEKAYFTAGKDRLVVEFRDIKFCLQICYDLRFPVWSRNKSGYDYDVLIYVAAWPTERIAWWDNLLIARSIENQAIVCGVNMVGTDGNGINYPGHSTIIDTRLNHLISFNEQESGIKIAEIDIASLQHFRERCPMYKEADQFEIIDN